MTRPSLIRCFLAASVSSREVIEALTEAIQPLRRFRGVKWVPPHQFHYTLKFLGEVDPGRVKTVSAVLDAVAGTHSAFDLTLAGLGAFPPRGDARIVWAGASLGAQILELIARELDQGLGAEGFDAETRPFAAHLTIGRVKDPREARGIREALVPLSKTFGNQHLSEIVLYKSELAPAGPIYTPLHKAPLVAA
ncbi:MAG: RNA 2',3'-cyclic phosphodiesterase [Thermoanaerobaculia bacterium]|nr:RNA 2',3'-cyclic phosphodiesterase [Thermoanaerobaculia bacterium]